MKRGDCFVDSNGTIDIYRGEKYGYAYFWMIPLGEKPRTRTMVPAMARRFTEKRAWIKIDPVELYEVGVTLP